MNYQVVIVGAGMVGATLAAALGRQGVSVALVERAVPEQPGSSVGLRVSAISPTSQQILTALEVWSRIPAERRGVYQRMQVWDGLSQGELSFDAAELGLPELGHIVENQQIQYRLWEVIAHLDNVVCYCPDQVVDLTMRDDQAQVLLEGGARLRCQLVVAADGARSQVRELAGLASESRDYQQSALVCHVQTEQAHQFTARQVFLPSGPLAFLPLADGRSSVVWSTEPEQADALRTVGEAVFSERLSDAFGWRLGAATLASDRASFPLHLRWSPDYIGERIALVGDAAHVVHPLAGLGVNLGLKDAAALAEVVTRALGRGQDLGAVPVLRRYQRWRKGDNMLTAATLHGLKHLFSLTFPPLAWARGLGMGAISSLGPVRNLLARHAVGQSGDLPQLARIQSGLPQ